MKMVKRLFKKLDFFGVPFSFKYKNKETYSTSLGGLFIILFAFVSIYLGIYNLIAFIHRENFSIIYYTMNIPVTEKIIFKNSKAALAFGFECDNKGRFKVDDVLDIEVNYVTYSKTFEGEYVKDKNILSTHHCKHNDFYNLYSNQFDYLNIQKYKCLDDNTQVIEGIWNDQSFTYYEISVTALNKTGDNLNNIEEYLFQNDCKFQLFYTDITIDLYNYKKPIAPYLNSIFIQLNPTLFIKRNIYFMNQYLSDDDYLLGVLNNYHKNIETKTLFSRYEEYYLYLGLNRSITNPPNTYDYAKLYIRADTKKTDIRRNYQKIMEFYANTTSLLIGIFRALTIIFNYINGFYSDNSLIRKLFFLKEFENYNKLDISKFNKKIKELISLTDSSLTEYSKENSFETNIENIKDYISNNNKFNNFSIKTFNNKNELYIDLRKDFGRNSFPYMKGKNNIKRIKINTVGIELNSSSKLEKEESKDNYKGNISDKKINDKDLNVKEKNNKKLEYSFNVIEIIIISLCKCCISKSLQSKKNINIKAKEILYYKLDIALYIRNMILIDLLNEIMLDKNKKDIINLLSRPLLSVNKNKKFHFSEFYNHFCDNDFNNFYEGVSELIQKSNKKEKEKKIILLVNNALKEFE